MNMKKLCALAIPLALAGCGGRSGAEDAVRAVLKDPDSAKFGEFYHNSDTGKACLTTNAKNSMGGYTGDKQVHLIKDKDGWQLDGEAEESLEECRTGYASLPSAEAQAEQAHAGATAEQRADRLEQEADRLEAAADRVRDEGTEGVTTDRPDTNANVAAYVAARARGDM